MGAQLNIKDSETIELARDLAKQLGKSVTATIREALEDKARRHEAEREAKVALLREIASEFRQNMPEEMRGKTSKEWMDGIYDDDGLPI